jgi:hypothetical protein
MSTQSSLVTNNLLNRYAERALADSEGVQSTRMDRVEDAFSRRLPSCAKLSDGQDGIDRRRLI